MWIDIFPLHRDIPKQEQEFLLKNTTGKPRIIVATSIAEESITIEYLDLVFNRWTHKVSGYNRLWIQELRLENASQANARQRAWRVGRTHVWEAIYSNETPFSELREFPEAPLEREMIDRYILLCLAQEIDILELYKQSVKKWEKLFFHNFDKNLFNISLQRLQRIGAINQNLQITALWRDLLSFPLDVYNARILRESIERWCTEDMIYATAILDKKGFLSKEDIWKRIKIPKSPEGDIFTYIELFKLATARTITKKQKENLISLGVPPEQLEKFEKGKGEYKLYEVVNLDIVDIKTKNIKEIDDLVDKLRERLRDMWVSITTSSDVNEKKICLVAGNLHNIFLWDPKSKKLLNRDHKKIQNPLLFTLWDVSVVKPKPHSLYIGMPFIIWWDDQKKDFPLVTFAIPIEESHIRSVYHDLESLFSYQIPALESTWKIQSSSRKPPASSTQVYFGGDTRSTQSTVPRTQQQDRKNSLGAELLPPQSSIAPIPVEAQSVQSEIIDVPHMPSAENTLTIERAIRYYSDALEEYERGTESNQFQTDESAREYYLKYCLPDLLIWYNQGIIKYLRDKSPEQIFIFRELLIQILLEKEVSRIRPNSIEQTERSFIYDSNILDDFLESKNPYIKAFREWRSITPLALGWANKRIIKLPIQSEDDVSTMDESIMNLQNIYAQAIWKVQKKYPELNVKKFKEVVVTKFLEYLEANSEAFANLANIYDIIWKTNKEQVAIWIKALKNLWRNDNEFKKLQAQKTLVLEIIETVTPFFSWEWKKDASILFALIEEWRFPLSNSSDVWKYVNWVQKGNKLQESKAKRELQKVLIDLNAMLLKIDIDLWEIIKKRNIEHIPVAHSISTALQKIAQQLFTPEYYRRSISPSFFEITRAIVRDQYTENRWLDFFLREFFESKDLSHSSQSFSLLFQKISSYNSLIETLEDYKKSVYQSVKESVDATYIESRIEELWKILHQLQHLRLEIDKLASKLSFREIPEKNFDIPDLPIRLRKKRFSQQKSGWVIPRMNPKNIDNSEDKKTSIEKEIWKLESRQKTFIQFHLKIKKSIDTDLLRAQYVLRQKNQNWTISRWKYKDFTTDQLETVILKKKQEQIQINDFIDSNKAQLLFDPQEYDKITSELASQRRKLSRRFS